MTANICHVICVLYQFELDLEQWKWLCALKVVFPIINCMYIALTFPEFKSFANSVINYDLDPAHNIPSATVHIKDVYCVKWFMFLVSKKPQFFRFPDTFGFVVKQEQQSARVTHNTSGREKSSVRSDVSTSQKVKKMYFVFNHQL